MGLDVNGIKLILYANKRGVDFKKVMTVGRQGLNLTNAQLLDQLSKFGIVIPENFHITGGTYSEVLFNILGATAINSIDNSAYEGATVVHDMNQPLSDKHKGQYSVVVDAGTLEHVFNIPVAIKNCMEMCCNGGIFISITPANNFMGHGFYQFSPEFFFSVFRQSNGFELVDLFICETHEDAQWYSVSAPKGGIQGRVTLRNHNPTYLMCIARRIDVTCEPFKTLPQQSDYLEAWTHPQQKTVKVTNHNWINECGLINAAHEILKKLPFMKPLIRNWRYIRERTYPKCDYIPFNPQS